MLILILIVILIVILILVLIVLLMPVIILEVIDEWIYIMSSWHELHLILSYPIPSYPIPFYYNALSYPITSYFIISYHITYQITHLNLTPKPRIHIFIHHPSTIHTFIHHHIISCNLTTTRRSFIHSYPASPLTRLEGKSTDNGNVFINVAWIDNTHVYYIYIVYWTMYTIYCISYNARLWILITAFTLTTATLPGLTFPITNNH